MKDSNFAIILPFMVNDLKLSGNDLLVYALISGASQDGVSSFAAPISYISEFYNISNRSVVYSLNRLVDLELVTKGSYTDNKNRRRCTYFANYWACNDTTYAKIAPMQKLHICKQEKTIEKNKEKVENEKETEIILLNKEKEKNIKENNKDRNREEENKEKNFTSVNSDTIKEIINYLNEKTGSRYTYKNSITLKHINARLREGFTLEDFKVVIDKKSKEWLNTTMAKFLRPETLFCGKFESYLNQQDVRGCNRNESIDDILNSIDIFN